MKVWKRIRHKIGLPQKRSFHMPSPLSKRCRVLKATRHLVCIGLLSQTQHLQAYEAAKQNYKEAVVKFQKASASAPVQRSAFIRHFQNKRDDPTAIQGACYYSLGQIAGGNKNFSEAKSNLEQAVAFLGRVESPL